MASRRGLSPSLHVLLVATGVTVLGVMPVFLVGAFGSVIRAEMGFDEGRLGLTVAVAFGSGAVTSVSIGRWLERVGARRGFVLALALSAAALLGIAALASSWTVLAMFIALGGVANGIAQPAGNLALARNLPARPGLVFGVKQSGAPAATLVAGGAVPLIGATVGWRWAFVAVASFAGLIAMTLPGELADRRTTRGRPQRTPDLRTGLLVGLATAAGIGVGAATSLAAFVVGSAVDDGLALTNAGWLLSAGSAAAIVARLGIGSLADRRRSGRLVLVSGMLFAGSAGYILLSFGETTLVWVGTVVAFAGGWGWTGLLMFATVHLSGGSPATATGVVQAGAATGAAVGPFAFGALVTHSSYAVAWRSAAVAALLSGVLILVVRARIVGRAAS